MYEYRVGETQLEQDKLKNLLGVGYVEVPDAATYTVSARNTDLVHILPDLTADIVITLPTPQDGLRYPFIYKGVAADAQDWQFNTGADANYYLGGVTHLDTNADAAGDEVVPVFSDGNSNSKFNVLTPQAGTKVELICD